MSLLPQVPFAPPGLSSALALQQPSDTLLFRGDNAQDRQLASWNSTASPYPQHTCFPQLFEAQVEQTPQATAAAFGSQRLTYLELNQRANQLAHYLRSLGVGPEALVGVCMERSLDLVVAILAIWKAGGAYLPLDPAYPHERLAYMLADSQISVLLSQAALQAKLPPHGARVICVDTQQETIAAQPTRNPASAATADNLAYVIYTSGSTGRPKGTMLEHRGLSNLTQAQVQTFGLGPSDRVLQFASSSFDASVFEIVMALRVGAALHLASREDLLPGPTLIGLLRDQAITIVTLPPSVLAALPDQGFPALRQIVVAGEACPPDLVDRWARGRRFFNAYGPTETTVWASVEQCRGDDERPSIGRPLINTTIYLLDAQLRPVPIGQPGEMYIGGVGLARGYLGRPDLTAERFVANPFAKAKGKRQKANEEGDDDAKAKGKRQKANEEGDDDAKAKGKRQKANEEGEGDDALLPFPSSLLPSAERLYRTGDLARYLPDGRIEFLGRVDQQVKLRGFRIELGEIEAVLSRHPAVQEGAVLMREDLPGQKRLVAYVVPTNDERRTTNDERRTTNDERRTTNDGRQETPGQTGAFSILHSPFSIQALRQFLAARLPEYMVPPVFVLLEAMPLTPNGKVDRKALPVPASLRPQLDAIAAPSSPTEELLAQIWGDVLRVEQVGVSDNFFELGGDSILSMQIISRAHQAGLQITISQFFQHPTIAELATVAGSSQHVQAEQGPVVGPVALTPIQSWFFEQEFAEPHHWNQAMLLELPAETDAAALERGVQALLTHHDALRLRFSRSAAGWQQFNAAPDSTIAFLSLDLSVLPQEDQRPALEIIAAEVQASLDLAESPRLRSVLFELGAGQPKRLLIVINYPAIDGVSWRILLEDLQTAYLQASRGHAIQLPAKTTSYQQWAERLAAYARTAAVRDELGFWLEAVKPGQALPIDTPGGDNREASARVVARTLPAGETRALLQDTPRAYCTQINDLLLTALIQAFECWQGIQNLLISLEGHGREDLFEDVNLSRTVGWFTSCFPVLLQLAPDASPGSALVATKEQLRRIPQHGIGYWQLRYLSANPAIVAQLRALPQPEVRFNYLGQFDQVVSRASLFRRARESYGPTRSPKGHRDHALVIEGLIAEGQLHVELTYSSNLHRRESIERLADAYIAALRGLIAHCLAPQAGRFTPSDFPLANLDEYTFRILATQIERLDALEGPGDEI